MHAGGPLFTIPRWATVAHRGPQVGPEARTSSEIGWGTSADVPSLEYDGCAWLWWGVGDVSMCAGGCAETVRGRPWRGEVRAVGSTLVNDTPANGSIGGVLSNRPRLRSVPLSWKSAWPTAGRLENPALTLHTATRVTGARTNALKYLTISMRIR